MANNITIFSFHNKIVYNITLIVFLSSLNQQHFFLEIMFLYFKMYDL